MTDLQRAIDYLTAKRIALAEYAYWDYGAHGLLVSFGHELRELGTLLRRRRLNAYSCWRAQVPFRRATPVQHDAFRAALVRGR